MKKIIFLFCLFIGMGSFSFGQSQLPDILQHFGYTTAEGFLDFGIMSENTARKKINDDFGEFLDKTNSRFTYSFFYDGIDYILTPDNLNSIVEVLERYQQPNPFHLYKAWWKLGGGYAVAYIWFGSTVQYIHYGLLEIPGR